MNGSGANSSSCSFGQHMVDQTPKYDNQLRKRRRKHRNQALGQTGILRPDKRHKVKWM